MRSTFLEEKRCAECGVLKRKNEYTAGQWKRADEKRICKECVARHVEDGAPWQCSVCSCWREPGQFPTKHQRAQCSFYRVCLTCKEQKKCDLCERDLEENQFSKPQWTRTRSGQRVCTACQKLQHGQWTCAVCATPVVCTHTSQVGGKPGQADKTDARSVIYAYAYSVRANEQTPGCSDAAARSRRLRLQRSCERCVQKFRRRTQRSAGSPTSRQQQQKDQPQQKNPKKNASTDTRKRLDASKVQRRSGRSTSARTATRRRTAAFALARFRSQGIAASSFVFDMATSCVRSPMLAPAVARRSSQRKRREEYRANTRSLMEKHAQQLSG